MKNKIQTIAKLILWAGVLAVTTSQVSYADAPPSEAYQETIPVNERAASDGSCWNTRLGAGVPVYFFDDEDNDLGGGVYLDIYCAGGPLNLRLGFEASHIDLEQAAALGNAEFPGKEVNASFFRIPFSVEYVMPVNDNFNFYVGVGPDLIHTANDVSETSVGFHTSARMAYDFNESWGLSVEGGYLWAEVDGASGSDINLDGAFVIPSIYYTF
ncbi:MAG: outer membrane beta-barrel protein [Bdellovibrionales bacterium]|nr:outer membrane beta-barrel protein [Bdellovibrionales bacterium]